MLLLSRRRIEALLDPACPELALFAAWAARRPLAGSRPRTPERAAPTMARARKSMRSR